MKNSYKNIYKNKMKNKITKKIILTFAALLLTFTTTSHIFASDITVENVTYLINKERSYYGLPPLKSDPDLNHAAKMKSRDMLNRNYFEHYALGLTPWDFINNAGYKYLYAGENLAMDFATSEGMFKAWMNSDLHRDNILNPNFEDMGIGVIKGAYTENGTQHETVIVTNMFGTKKPPIVDFFNKIINNISFLFGLK